MTLKNKKIWIKIFITLGLMLYLLTKINLKTINSILIEMNHSLLIFTIPFIVSMYLIKTKKWHILLYCIDLKISFYDALKIVLIGTFYGALTPGKAGEISRSFYLNYPKSKTIPTIILDRIVDVFCLLILSVLSLTFFFNDSSIIYLVSLITILFIFGTIIAINKKTVSFIFRFFKQTNESKENYIYTMKKIIGNKKILLYEITLTFSFYTIFLFVYWIILKSLDPALNDIIIFSLPIIIILGNIPISISGLGVREFVTVMIFSMLNEDASYGFSFSILIYVLTMLIPGLMGALILIRKSAKFK